jgi:CubicO group peptidase (beta-lactamase class C family)
MMKKIFSFFGGLIICIICISCAENQASKNDTPSYKKVRKRPLQNSDTHFAQVGKIDTMVQNFMQYWSLKGVSLAIVKDEKLIYAKGFGYADEAKKEIVTPHHLFRIASVSKLITAVAVMKLVEEHKLKLTDKVFGQQGILNEYKEAKDPRALQIEVQHLLTHTGGWKNKFRTDPMFIPLEIAEYMKVKPPINLDIITRFMLSQKMIAQPGTFFDYSNFGYCLLGKVIERISGMDYENFVKQKIFKSLEINQIHLGKNFITHKAPTEVSYYEHFGAKSRPAFDGTNHITRPYGIDIETLGAAGGWIASPKELLKFLNYIDGFAEKEDIISPQTLALMTSQQDSTRTIGWRNCKEDIWLRTGSLVGTQTVLARQQDGFSWVIVSNTSTWRAHRFSYDLLAFMKKVIKSVPNKANEDLFDYQ